MQNDSKCNGSALSQSKRNHLIAVITRIASVGKTQLLAWGSSGAPWALPRPREGQVPPLRRVDFNPNSSCSRWRAELSTSGSARWPQNNSGQGQNWAQKWSLLLTSHSIICSWQSTASPAPLVHAAQPAFPSTPPADRCCGAQPGLPWVTKMSQFSPAPCSDTDTIWHKSARAEGIYSSLTHWLMRAALLKLNICYEGRAQDPSSVLHQHREHLTVTSESTRTWSRI